MISVLIADAMSHVGEEVELRGWIVTTRSSGKISFLECRDGSGHIQVVFEKSAVSDEVWERLRTLRIESSIVVRGTVMSDPRSPMGIEIRGSDCTVIQLAPEDYPIGKKEHGPEFLLDQRHLWIRSQTQWAIQRIRHTIIQSTFAYFDERGWVKFDSPILTPTACEGTTELFEVPYFDLGSAYLSQSGQLYLEAGIMALGKCFDFGPVFRAEKSKTRRHLTEFWMMDAEAAFADHEQNMRTQEELICRIVQDVLAKRGPELSMLERDLEPLKAVQAPFVHLTHAEAVAQLRTLGSDIGDMDDLGADDETIHTKLYHRPIFVERYPAAVKAFYMKRDPADPSRVLNNDLLAPEGYGEIIGGSQREDDHDRLLARIQEHGLSVEANQWYLDLRKYGSVPHAGFGYGLERIVTWICGLHHVRETIPFPRMIHRLTP